MIRYHILNSASRHILNAKTAVRILQYCCFYIQFHTEYGRHKSGFVVSEILWCNFYNQFQFTWTEFCGDNGCTGFLCGDFSVGVYGRNACIGTRPCESIAGGSCTGGLKRRCAADFQGNHYVAQLRWGGWCGDGGCACGVSAFRRRDDRCICKHRLPDITRQLLSEWTKGAVFFWLTKRTDRTII